MREQAGSLSGLIGLAVDPDLAVDVVGAAGGILSQIIRWAVSKRRGRYLALFALAGVILGILVGGLLGYQFLGLYSIFNFVFVLFVGSTIVAAYQVLR